MKEPSVDTGNSTLELASSSKWHRVSTFCLENPATILIGYIAVAIVAVFIYFNSLQDTLIETMALTGAKSYSRVLEEFRSLYSSEVVAKAKRHGMKVTRDYEEIEDAIPLPGKLARLVGSRMSGESSRISLRMFSPYPFPARQETGGLQDSFDREAWDFLQTNPDKAFHQFSVDGDHLLLRYASADIMGESCVNCHNSHPYSPKRDWKIGDTRGIVEVTVSLDTIAAQNKVASKATMVFLFFLGVLGLSSILLVNNISRKQSTILKNLVEKRTMALTRSHELLRKEMLEHAQSEKENLDIKIQLIQAQKLESVGRLATGIAHEINTPIQFIGDNTTFLKEAFSEQENFFKNFDILMEAATKGDISLKLIQEIEKDLEDIDIKYLRDEIPVAILQMLEGIQRISEIVQAMKEYAHPGVLEKQDVDINMALNSTLTVARNEWRLVADIKTEYNPGLPLVSCFAGELKQVFLNLIVNAVHAITETLEKNNGEKGLLTIKTRLADNWVEIDISDTGTGIPTKAQDKIFDPFFTTKEVGKGTGQGLSLAYNIIVQKHGGTIDFKTESGKGTTFTVRLPLYPDKNIDL